MIYSVQSAVWYWNEGNKKVYETADIDDVVKATKAVNGGYNGLDDRNEYTKMLEKKKG